MSFGHPVAGGLRFGRTNVPHWPDEATTTRTPKRSTKPSSIALRSPPTSGPSSTPERSARCSSTTTTMSIVTRASGFTRQPQSTTAPPPRSANDEPKSSTPPTPPTQTGSAASTRPHRSFPPLPGSTTPHERPSYRASDQPVVSIPLTGSARCEGRRTVSVHLRCAP